VSVGPVTERARVVQTNRLGAFAPLPGLMVAHFLVNLVFSPQGDAEPAPPSALPERQQVQEGTQR